MSRAAIHLELNLDCLVQIYQMFSSLQPSEVSFLFLVLFQPDSSILLFFFHFSSHSFYPLYSPAAPESAIHSPVITVYPELVQIRSFSSNLFSYFLFSFLFSCSSPVYLLYLSPASIRSTTRDGGEKHLSLFSSLFFLSSRNVHQISIIRQKFCLIYSFVDSSGPGWLFFCLFL